MNIAICDDRGPDARALQDMLSSMAENIAIEFFDTGQGFLDAAVKRRYDLVFMDVFLKGASGIDVARQLSAVSPATRVVFTTCSDAHAVEAFSVRALHYLVKPFTQSDITEVMERMKLVVQPRAPESTLTVRIGNDVYTLSQSEIMRVESSNHKTNIFMRNGSVYSIWLPFRKVADQLNKDFLVISRGVAVNMRHIVKWQSGNCQMSDGVSYLLSRNHRQVIRQAYNNYKMDEMLEGQTRPTNLQNA